MPPLKKVLLYISIPLIAFLIVLGVALFIIFYQGGNQEAVAVKPGLKLVIDHDGGADDALAITMSLLYEKYFDGPKVVALTTTYGNVNQSQSIINSARILNLCDRADVPIYAGATRNLISGIISDYYFGYDGLGDNGYLHTDPIKVEDAHAAVGLIELSKKYKDELIVMAIGPVTNIALAMRLDPEFVSRLAHLYVGGGHIYGETQTEPEFNADMDPESYQIVADGATVGKVTFVPFSQVSLSLTISKEWRENVLGVIDTPIIKALNSFERLSLAASKTWALLDPAVAAIVLDSSIVEELKNTSNGIILCGVRRGINTNNFTSSDPNSRLVYSANVDTYKNLLLEIYSAELTQ